MMKHESISTRQNWLTALLLLISVAGATLISLYLLDHVQDLEGFILELGILGPLLSILLQSVLGASPIPTEPLTMVNGALFGPWMGAFISWIGYMFASWIEYFIGRNISQAAEFEEKRHRLPFGLGNFPADSPLFLMAVRIVPGYGPKMVGLVGGMYRVPLWRYTWTAALPNFLGALAFAAGGFGLRALIGLA